MTVGKSFDRYVIQARIMPTLVVVFPLSTAVAAWIPKEEVSWKLLSGLGTMVLFTLLAQIGRDPGKDQQADLFRKWGGKPSTKKLRHRDTDLNWITLARLHDQLASEVGVPFPTAQQEEADPVASDAVYEAFGDHMREATRGDAILFSENVSYGFRRSLWGMKSVGIILAIAGAITCATKAIMVLGEPAMTVPAITTLLNATVLAIWLCRVQESWVRMAAEAYADRLVKAFLSRSVAATVTAKA